MKWYEVPADQYTFWEKRMKVSEIIDEMKIAFDSEANVLDIYNAIVAFSKEHRIGPRHYSWTLTTDNVLMVEGSPLKRVGPKKVNSYGCDDAAAYWEDRILARQEAWQD